LSCITVLGVFSLSSLSVPLSIYLSLGFSRFVRLPDVGSTSVALATQWLCAIRFVLGLLAVEVTLNGVPGKVEVDGTGFQKVVMNLGGATAWINLLLASHDTSRNRNTDIVMDKLLSSGPT